MGTTLLDNPRKQENVVTAFTAWVVDNCNAIAVTCRGEGVSYGELDELSARVESFLRSRGVRMEEPVGLFMSRGAEAIAAIVGIVKSGAAYVPLDTASPAARLQLIVEECGVRRVLVDSADRAAEARACFGAAVEVEVFGELPNNDQGPDDRAWLEPVVSPDQLAYIIYTSGSTGVPKGVSVSHGDLLALTRDPCWSGLDQSVLHHSPLNFDASVFEMWMPLLRGGRVVVAPNEAKDPAALGRLIADEKVSCAFVTTSLFNVLIEEYPGVFVGLRQVWTGGEAASPAVVQRAMRAYSPGSVVNVYGPTEATVFATMYVVPEEVPAVVPIGRPLADVRAYVLDEALRPAGIGQDGELCLAGTGVARGYHRRPALTAERFMPDPFSADGRRMYRTGDIVRRTPDGLLEFVGRRDRQVKVRGFRIELGEIENQLAQRDDVAAVAVITDKDRHGDTTLHAYLVQHDVREAGEKRPADPAWGLRVLTELRDSLPAYMVPSSCTVLDHLPMTRSGKLDHRALPAPARTARGGSPRTHGEERLCRIFAEVLGLENVGIDDHFFQLGGHSLLAVRVAARIGAAWGVRLGVQDLFDAPTVAQLTGRLAGAVATDAAATGMDASPGPLTPRPRPDRIPLSYAQRRLWFLNRLDVETGLAYHIPVAYRLRREVDTQTLRAALKDVVERHESLRTVFPSGRDDPVQHVLGAGEWDLDVTVTRCEPEALEQGLIEATRVPFDLERDLPIRAVLFQTAAETVLLLVLHHIGADGWSLSPLTRDLGAAYTARACGQAPQFAPLPAQYPDFTLWQQALLNTGGDAWRDHLRYWTTRLAGIPDELALPADRPRPAVASHRGDLIEFEMSAELCRDLEKLAWTNRTSLFVVLQAGLACLLTRLGAGEDIVIGSPIAGRPDGGLDELIGFFVNTVVLRTDTSGNPSFGDLLGRVRENWLSAYAHQDIPFDLLVQELNPPRSLAQHPVFQVALGLLNAPGLVRDLDGLSGHWRVGNAKTAKFDLSFTLTPRRTAEGKPDGLDGAAEYATDLFDADTVRLMIDRLILLLRDAAHHPDRPLGSLRVVDKVERAELLAGDSTHVDGRTVVQHFRAQVEFGPGRPAVADGEARLSYRQLDDRSGALGRYLAARGHGPESCVALLMDRGADAVTAFLGVLKAGGAYVPLDPRFPTARMVGMIAECGARIVLVDTAKRADLVRGFVGAETEVILVETAVRKGRHLPTDIAAADPVDADQLAYVMYTSGSTGTPKGVAVTHRDILGLAADDRWSVGVERVLLHSPLAFDASTFEVWVPLLHGGCIVVAPVNDDGVSRLHQVIAEEQVTAVFMTTALFNLMVQEHPEVFSQLAQIWAGGEAASPAAFSRARELAAPGAVVHVYGPTEATTFATCYTVDAVGPTTVCLGEPMDGVRTYVVDQFGELAGAGMSGELYLGGIGVARCYMRRPGLTAERFVPDPYGPSGSRMYRTGDIFRRRADGQLEFAGRLDRQVKIRGFRIEPGEIEATLTQQPDVGQAAVAVHEEPAVGKTLVAYVVPSAGRRVDRAELSNRLRAGLNERLPGYMVPSAFVVLDALPMTTNGKVDWRALPRPVAQTMTREPRTDIERMLCGLFADVLGRSAVGVGAEDSFFELGGHSILAVRLAGRLRADYGVDISVRALFTSPTPAGLAGALDDETRRWLLAAGRGTANSDGPRADAASPGTSASLSFAQQRLWFLAELWPGRSDYNVPDARRLTGPLDVSRLRMALTELLRRHEILRTRYDVRDDEPVQIVEPLDEPLLCLTDCEDGTVGDPELWARRAIDAEVARPFDLCARPPVRFHLLTLAEHQHILLMVIHHIATDGWSNQLLWRDLADLYNRGTRAAAPASALRYADYAHWERERQCTPPIVADLDFWRDRLANLSPVELPGDRPRPAIRSGRGAQRDFEISGELRERLLAIGKRSGATPFVTLLTAFQLLVAGLTGQRDIALGVPVAGRSRPELETLCGFFANTIVLRGDMDMRCDFAELLRRGSQAAADAYSHADLPFERLVGDLQPERDLSRNPLFQLMFSMADTGPESKPSHWDGLVVDNYPVPFMAAKFDFEIAMTDRGDCFQGHTYYCTDLFDADTVDRILRLYLQLLIAVADSPDVPVAKLDVVTAEAERLAQTAWNDTAADVDLDHCLHEWVTRQARRTPEAVAVEHGEAVLTYAQLDQWSDRLAGLLRTKGLQPADPVGVWLDRCIGLPAALLAVLKAGGAYVPLDPDLPAARAAQLLAQAGAELCVIADPPCGALPDGCGVRTVVVDGEAQAREVAVPLGVPVHPDDLASIYFTSGSTGVPKGVANTHRGWVNRMWWMHRQHGLLAGDGVLHKTVLSFDDSAVELFWPLMVGGRIVMLDPGMHRDPRGVLRAAVEHRVAVLQFVPSMLGLFLDEVTDDAVAGLTALRHVISSGEALHPDLLARFYERLGAAGCALHNQWGPTEASIDATWHRCRPEDAMAVTVPIGRPLSNYQVHVLDEAMLPLPPGVEGELFIGGVGLARGYWNDPAKTASAFVPDVFRPSGRLYRTGDRGTRLPDGTLLFHGRADHQVKVSGVRVELGEIEAVLVEHEDVAQAAVRKWKLTPGDQRLAGYVVPVAPQVLDPVILRRYLADWLPPYMVPSHLIVLPEFPLTASGKLDYNRLPSPQTEPGKVSAGGRPPSTESELLVAEVWADVLPADDVDVDFFALGGHSLLASKIMSRLRRLLDAELPLVLLFEHPTIAQLAAAVERELNRMSAHPGGGDAVPGGDR